MIKIFVSLILLLPIFLLFKLTRDSLRNDHENAAAAFGFAFIFSIIGYFAMIFNLFGNGF